MKNMKSNNKKAKIYLHRDTEQSIINYSSKWMRDADVYQNNSNMDIASVQSFNEIRSIGSSSINS